MNASNTGRGQGGAQLWVQGCDVLGAQLIESVPSELGSDVQTGQLSVSVQGDRAHPGGGDLARVGVHPRFEGG